jgi:hypothetical protein
VGFAEGKEYWDESLLGGRAKWMAKGLFAEFWQKDREHGFLKSATFAKNGF